MDDVRVERALRVAESIPAGKVATYGDIATVVGESARWVGRVMTLYGANVPWWRVVNAQGTISGHTARAYVFWCEEGTPVAGQKVCLSLARLAVDELLVLSKERVDELAQLGVDCLDT